MNSRNAQVQREMTVHATLEDLRQREHLEHRERRADCFRVTRLIGVANRRRPSPDGDDRLGPQLRVHHLFGAVPREIEDELRVARPPHHLAEDEPAVQLGRAVEVEQ